MPVGLRTKKATKIAQAILGVPVTMRDQKMEPFVRKVDRAQHMDPNKIHADDTGVGRRFV